MTGYRPGIYWQYTWRYIGPVIMTAILITSVISMVLKNPTYSAWNADEVRRAFSKLPQYVVYNTDQNYMLTKTGQGSDHQLPDMGTWNRLLDDHRRCVADATRLFAAPIPNSGRRSRHSPGIDSKERDDYLNEGHDGRRRCKSN